MELITEQSTQDLKNLIKQSISIIKKYKKLLNEIACYTKRTYTYENFINDYYRNDYLINALNTIDAYFNFKLGSKTITIVSNYDSTLYVKFKLLSGKSHLDYLNKLHKYEVEDVK